MNYAIILAGGVGSRFWPISRTTLPKQFIKFAGDLTLFQNTIMRIRGIVEDKRIFIISHRRYLGEIKRQMIRFSIPHRNIILEPQGRNTLPAISLCAHQIYSKDKDALLLIFPSDHLS